VSEGETRPRGADAVRAALVLAATRLLGDAPPERISGRRLAEEAGVNYGLVHHYFGGKEAVLREGFRRMAEEYTVDSGLGSGSPVAPFSLRESPGYVRALAYASLSGRISEARGDHSVFAAAVDQSRKARPADDEREIRADVALATVFHASRCLFAETIDPWLVSSDAPAEKDRSPEAVEERLVLILQALNLGLDPGLAAAGQPQPVRRSSAPG